MALDSKLRSCSLSLIETSRSTPNSREWRGNLKIGGLNPPAQARPRPGKSRSQNGDTFEERTACRRLTFARSTAPGGEGVGSLPSIHAAADRNGAHSSHDARRPVN